MIVGSDGMAIQEGQLNGLPIQQAHVNNDL